MIPYFIIFFIGVIIFSVLWLMSGVYLSKANKLIKPYKKNGDNYIEKAAKYIRIGESITWSLVSIIFILIVLLIIGLFFGISEMLIFVVFTSKTIISVVLIIITAVLLLMNGILASMGAVNVRKSNSYDGDETLKQVHKYCIIASLISLLTLGLCIVAIIVILFLKYRKKPEKTPEKTNSLVSSIVDVGEKVILSS